MKPIHFEILHDKASDYHKIPGDNGMRCKDKKEIQGFLKRMLNLSEDDPTKNISFCEKVSFFFQ